MLGLNPQLWQGEKLRVQKPYLVKSIGHSPPIYPKQLVIFQPSFIVSLYFFDCICFDIFSALGYNSQPNEGIQLLPQKQNNSEAVGKYLINTTNPKSL
jgi:hypothetical protein